MNQWTMRRRKPCRDTTPCTVTVTPGHLVFHDGAQRDGTLHDVPKHLAMHWQKHHFATIVDEPVGAGAASNTEHVDITRVQDVAMTASFAASHDLRDADTDHTATGGTPGTSSPAPARRGYGEDSPPVSTDSRSVLQDFVCTVPATSPDTGVIDRSEGRCMLNSLQDNVIDLSPYRLDSAADASAGPVSGGEARTVRTGCVRVRACARIACRRCWAGGSGARRHAACRHTGTGLSNVWPRQR